MSRDTFTTGTIVLVHSSLNLDRMNLPSQNSTSTCRYWYILCVVVSTVSSNHIINFQSQQVKCRDTRSHNHNYLPCKHTSNKTTMTSKEIPYEDHEVINDSINAATSATSNKEEDSPSSSCELALVPLHPACKKQKLEAKQLPIVLGRTNLASWWWKSCPCQHYCRLHCRPVAQNIRSLSKVMIQIDTAGRVHLVGKNPHLVTITPERNDHVLQVNDILSIGRRDREPWMRLQVVRKPENILSQQPPKKQKTHTPDEWMNKQTNKPQKPSSNNDNFASLPRNNNNSTHNSSRKTSSPSNNPFPEWITTHTRKRKSSSTRCTNAKQQQQRTVTAKLVEAAFAAASDNLKQSYAKGGNNRTGNSSLDSDSNVPLRKRRRTREMSGKKASRGRERTSRNESARKSNDEGNERNRNTGNGAAVAAQTEREHQQQVHLVFQDYETSAMLVQGTQRKQKHKTNNVNTDGTSNRGLQVPRIFISDKNQFDKSQFRLLSKNFAAALLGSVSPATGHNLGSPQDGAVDLQPGSCDQQRESQEAYAKAEASLPEYDTKPCASTKDPMDRQLEALAESKQQLNESSAGGAKATNLSWENECGQDAARKVKNYLPANSGDSTSITENITQKRMLLVGQCLASNSNVSLKKAFQLHAENNGTHQEASMLSLPQCESSNFEPGQAAFLQQPESEKKDSAEDHSASSSDESESSPPSRDPVSDLASWKIVVEQEQRGSFRHALASLIVAKNEKERQNENGLLWLPSLIDGEFQIDPTSP